MKIYKAGIAAVLLGASWAVSAAGGWHLLEANADLDDKASLQRGAKMFVNYCLGCHSLNYMRYNRMGRDLGIPEKLVQENLVFTGGKVVDEMRIAMHPEDAKRWFGVAPPDLSVIARARGADWLYSYLVSFYVDPRPSRRFGVNNVVFPDVGMPHVLWSLQGQQEYVEAERPAGTVSVHPGRMEVAGETIRLHQVAETDAGHHEPIVDELRVAVPGSMQPGLFRKSVRDLVNFLVYVGEPAKLVRHSVGFWVVVFLLVFLGLARALYQEYWRDVH